MTHIHPNHTQIRHIQHTNQTQIRHKHKSIHANTKKLAHSSLSAYGGGVVGVLAGLCGSIKDCFDQGRKRKATCVVTTKQHGDPCNLDYRDGNLRALISCFDNDGRSAGCCDAPAALLLEGERRPHGGSGGQSVRGLPLALPFRFV